MHSAPEKVFKNLLYDLRNYQSRMRNLFVRLMTLLIIWVILTATLLTVTTSYLNDLGNSRLINMQSSISTLWDSLNTLVLDLTQKDSSGSSADVYDPEMSDLNALEQSLPVSCIEQIMIYDEESGIMYTDHGAYVSSFLDQLLAEFGETSTHYTARLNGLSEPAWLISDSDDIHLYCLAPIDTGTGLNSEWLILILDMDALQKYLDTLDDQSWYYLTFEDLYISNTGFGRLSGDLTVSNLRNETGTGVQCFSLSDETFTYTVAIPRGSYYLSVFVECACFFFYALLLLFLEARNFAVYRKQNAEELSQTIDDILNLLHNRAATDAVSRYLNDISRELLRFRDTAYLAEQNERDNQLRNILFGRYRESPSSDILKHAELDSSCAVYLAAAFFIPDYSDMFYDDREPGENVRPAYLMLRSVLTGVSSGRCHVVLCGLDGGCCAVFCMRDAATAEITASEILREVLDIVDNSCGLSPHVILSQTAETAGQIHDVYRETERTWRRAQAIGSSSRLILCSRQTLHESLDTEQAFLTQLRILAGTAQEREYDRIPEIVETLIRDSVLPVSDNVTLTQRRLQSLTSLLAEAVMSAALPAGQVEAYANELLSISSAEELLDSTSRIFRTIRSPEQAIPGRDIVAEARSYVASHISDPNLSVILVSDYLGVSRQYLSRVFKQRMSTTMAAYINEYRISRSKELLSDTNLSISQIAEAVGYALPETYTRNFKKLEGMTPAEYRRMLQ